MPDQRLERLRVLRAESEELLKCAGKDISGFINDDGLTFVRLPGSLRLDDINVTTTCSCLMALATTNQADVVYTTDCKDKLALAFAELLQAPWMSSGLTENNAFTTTLVIRCLGFLVERGNIPVSVANERGLKRWDLGLAIHDRAGFLKLIKDEKQPVWRFVWRALSDKLRTRLRSWEPSSSNSKATEEIVRSASLELQRLIEATALYTREHFPKTKIDVLKRERTAYDRAAVNYELLIEAHDSVFRPHDRSLREIADQLASDPDNFTINEYDPSPAIIYWFVDGVTRARITLPRGRWKELAKWATNEFNHQLSLVVAGNEAMMDPVSMAMAACLCARLKVAVVNSGAAENDLEILPSRPELEHAIKELFRHQRNGIWPKYFPLFHYPEGGSNYCFTFELLEAILVEFGGADSALLDDASIIAGFEQAVIWCKKNRLQRTNATGWNSGGSLETLAADQPESWATAVVYMFLWELQDVLSRRIQHSLVKVYKTSLPADDDKGLGDLLDIEIFDHGRRASLQNILQTQIIEPHKAENENSLRRQRVRGARSALLFGPPGTSKTDVCKAVAKGLGWPLIQIDPSDFLRESLDRIYVEAADVFRDLNDLSGVVVLFDEMDALVQTRDAQQAPETAAQFLTTFMLPKLTELHNRGRVVFFMATNFRDRFDPAITRPGRFDLLLCMGPPTLEEKLNHLHIFTNEEPPAAQQTAQAFRRLLAKVPKVALQLELYTFAEFRGFIKSLEDDRLLYKDKIERLSAAELKDLVDADSESVTLKVPELQALSSVGVSFDSIDEFKGAELKRKQVDDHKIELTQAIRYALDWRVSRTTKL